MKGMDVTVWNQMFYKLINSNNLILFRHEKESLTSDQVATRFWCRGPLTSLLSIAQTCQLESLASLKTHIQLHTLRYQEWMDMMVHIFYIYHHRYSQLTHGSKPPECNIRKLDFPRLTWTSFTGIMACELALAIPEINLSHTNSIVDGFRLSGMTNDAYLFTISKRLAKLTGACFRLKLPHRFVFFRVSEREQPLKLVSTTSSLAFFCFIGFPSWPRQSDAPQWHNCFVPNWINLVEDSPVVKGGKLFHFLVSLQRTITFFSNGDSHTSKSSYVLDFEGNYIGHPANWF